MLIRSISTASLMAKTAVVRGILLVIMASTALSSCNDTDAPASRQSASPDAASAQAERTSAGAQNQFTEAGNSPATIAEMRQAGTASLDSVTPAGTAGAQQPPLEAFRVTKGKLYRIDGYAINKDAGTVPPTIRIMLVGDSAYELIAKTGVDRGDVADYFKNTAFATAGFSTEAAFDNVRPGTYTVFAVEGDGSAMVSHPTHKTISVQ